MPIWHSGSGILGLGLMLIKTSTLQLQSMQNSMDVKTPCTSHKIKEMIKRDDQKRIKNQRSQREKKNKTKLYNNSHICTGGPPD